MLQGVRKMWIVFAFGSAFFAGITAILAKCGIRETDSTVATAIRTIVVLAFSWLMVLVAGSVAQIVSIDGKTWLFLILSGLATGASWLCYFKALQLGDINKVVPVDKSSVILTMLLAFILLHESISLFGGIGVVLIAAGTFLMIEKKDVKEEKQGPKKRWLCYRFGCLCQPHIHSRQNRNFRCGIQSRNGHSHRRGAHHGMGHGADSRQGERRQKGPQKRDRIYLPFGHCHRRLLALLLPGAPGWASQRSRSH